MNPEQDEHGKVILVSRSTAPDLFHMFDLFGLHFEKISERLLVFRNPTFQVGVGRPYQQLLSPRFAKHESKLNFREERITLSIYIDGIGESAVVHEEEIRASYVDHTELTQAVTEQVANWNSLLSDYGVSFAFRITKDLSDSQLFTLISRRDYINMEKNRRGIADLFGASTIGDGALTNILYSKHSNIMKDYYSLWATLAAFLQRLQETGETALEYSKEEAIKIQAGLYLLFLVNPRLVDMQMLFRVYVG